MELDKIENLLEKYFDGNTSLEEEKTLQTYFTQAHIPSHLQEYQAMFAYFSENRTEVSKQAIQIKTKKKTWQLSGLSIAAAVLLLLSVIWFVKPTKLTEAEREEAQLAYIETQKAFQLISQNLNKGNNAVAYLQDYEVAKNKIFKTNK